jgi:hypothetical protein
MYDAGIRAFYALGEPVDFRPTRRRTFLSPEYLSPEYLDRVYFAYKYAKEKGMHSWLYNEGGFPSGMVCGKIRKLRPDLARLDINKVAKILPAGTPYEKSKDALSGFIGSECGFCSSTLNLITFPQYLHFRSPYGSSPPHILHFITHHLTYQNMIFHLK